MLDARTASALRPQLSRLYRAAYVARKIVRRRLRGAEGWLRRRWPNVAPFPPTLTRPDRIVFVCTGNICRSAFAEYRYRQIDSAMQVASIGIDVRTSRTSPQAAIECAQQFGIDMRGHRSQPPHAIEDTPGTLYLVMEPWQARARALSAAREQGRVHLLARWDTPSRAVLDDPYGRSTEEFRACFERIDTILERMRDGFLTDPGAAAEPSDGRPRDGLRKRVVGLTVSAPARFLLRPWTLDRVPVIMFHRFSADPNCDSGRTSAALLDRCLRFVREQGYTPLSLGDLCARLRDGQVPRRAITFTVDDGYVDFGEIAHPVFRRYDVPVTVFVSSGFIDGTLWYWWDQLRYMFDRTDCVGLSIRLRNGVHLDLRWSDAAGRRAAYGQVAEACKEIPHEEKRAALLEIQSRLGVAPPTLAPPDYRGLTWDDVRRLSQDGVEFGGHTVTHPILSQIPLDRQRTEVAESLRAIERNTGIAPRTFAYPNGRTQDLGSAVDLLLERSGVSGAVTVERDFVSSSTLSDERAFYRLPRLSMPSSYDRFVRLVSGFTALRIALGWER